MQDFCQREVEPMGKECEQVNPQRQSNESLSDVELIYFVLSARGQVLVQPDWLFYDRARTTVRSV